MTPDILLPNGAFAYSSDAMRYVTGNGRSVVASGYWPDATLPYSGEWPRDFDPRYDSAWGRRQCGYCGTTYQLPDDVCVLRCPSCGATHHQERL